MAAHGLAFRQDFAAPLPIAAIAPDVSPAHRLQALLIDQQRDDGHWTDEWSSQPTMVGPVGVTARAVIALIESGMLPTTPALCRAIDWLWGRTVAPAAKDPDPPEAESLAALHAFLRSARIAADGRDGVAGDAVQALREIQSEDGSWMMDGKSDLETTGEILTVLGLCGITAADATVRPVLALLESEERPDGGWSDLGATAAVLTGLQSVGVDGRWLPVRRAAQGITRAQLANGGWGSAGQADVVETANAIRALRAAGERTSAEVEVGREWIAANLPDKTALAPLIAALRIW